MANFKTHISWGVVLGVGVVTAALIYSMFSGVESILWVFFAVLVGSFLPDVDSDNGIPFQILFGLLGAGLAGAAFFSLYQGGQEDLKFLIALPVLVFILVRFGAGYVFKKFTHHRGIFHSIPAAILSGLSTIWFLKLFSITGEKAMFAGLAVIIGYFGHLVLDEIYASVNLQGRLFIPKRSLGSALKFYSSSRPATVLVYIMVISFLVMLPEVRTFLFHWS